MSSIASSLLKKILTTLFITTLVACTDTPISDFDDSSSSSSSGSSASMLIGTWSLDSAQAQGGTVTISFDSGGRGQNFIDVPGFQQETRGYSYRKFSDQIYFTYDETGAEGSPSTIIELAGSKLTMRNPDNSTGYYTRVGSSGGSSSDGSSTTTTSSGTSGGTNSGSGTQSCNAQITMYTTVGSGGPVSVRYDNVLVGTLTQYITSGTPTCGIPTSSSVITFPVTDGTHTIYAEDDTGTWGPSEFIGRCGCMLYGLN